MLAHQELQHTLTEQAVLKRMAAEGADNSMKARRGKSSWCLCEVW